MSDTNSTPATGFNLDQSIEEMLDVVGTAGRTRDEAKAQANTSHSERLAELETAMAALTSAYNTRKAELNNLRTRLQTAYNEATQKAEQEFNKVVHGDPRGPQYNQYGESNW